MAAQRPGSVEPVAVRLGRIAVVPTYEYSCTSCHRRTEAVQRFSDPPLTECEHCGGQLKRVFHPVGIVLKGSGFYSTDAKGGSSKGASSKSSEGRSSETKQDTTKSDGTKPASATSETAGAANPAAGKKPTEKTA